MLSSGAEAPGPNTNLMRLRYFLILVGLLPQLSFAALDLTPRFIDTFADGITFHRLYFSDGEKKFVLSLNRETEVTAEGNGALFRFTKLKEAKFLLSRSRLSPSDVFEGAALERYREGAKRLMPARGVTILEEVLNPLPINGWKSFRLTLSGEVNGQKYLQSVTFVNLNDSDQVVLVTIAPERSFPEAADRSFQIFRTWQEMLPGDERPATSN
ncbi:MAG: hypothetical protein JWQ44_1817 [Chthoniobacter sp.]|nr:hypothetical protein [Chthoniobacter sp.]